MKTTPPLNIRQATQEDGEKLSDLLTQLGYPGTEGFIRKKISQMTSHPDAELVVAEEEGCVVGLLSIHIIPQIALEGSFARISYLCVDESARGKGIGKALESYCRRLAGQRGCDRIELHCHDRRKKAHGFYTGLGYEDSPKYFVKTMRKENF